MNSVLGSMCAPPTTMTQHTYLLHEFSVGQHVCAPQPPAAHAKGTQLLQQADGVQGRVRDKQGHLGGRCKG